MKRFTYLYPIASVFFFFVPLYTWAQMPSLQNIGQTPAALEITPLYPAANQTMNIRLGDYSETFGGQILWYINGVRKNEYDNKQSITESAPELGVPLKIEARGAGGASASAVIVPSTVDIIIEGETTAPYFYKGRRVPGLGTTARVSLVPHIFDIRGRKIPQDQLLYTWSVDGRIASERSGAILSLPLGNFGSPLVSVVIDSPRFETRYETAFYAQAVSPSLSFHLHNPLTGLSRVAIQEGYLRTQNEATIRAEVYGMGKDVYRNAEHGWTINGEKVSGGGSDPHLITLQKQGGGGVSEVGFTLRNLASLSQYVADMFRLEF